MHTQSLTGGGPRPAGRLQERRSKPRIYEPFPAVVVGVDGGGVFEAETFTENFSAAGLYLRLRQRLEPGATLFIVVHMPTSGEGACRVAVHGVVLRSELQEGGACGLAVRFMHHKFL